MTKSDQINDLIAALVKVQAEMQPAEKNRENPFFKSSYADHVSVIAASRPLLTKNNLCVTQTAAIRDGKQVLETVLAHSSGQWISSEMYLSPPKTDAQSFGSYLTYMRRYGEMAIIGLAAEDDDGEASMVRNKKAPHHPPPVDEMSQVPPEPSDWDEKKISEAQGKRLFAIARKSNWTDEHLRNFIAIKTGQSSTKNIPWTAYEPICDHIERNPKVVKK